MKRRIIKAFHVLATEGPVALLHAVARVSRLYMGGKLVQFRGNRVDLEGLSFSLDSEAISVLSRGWFVLHPDEYEINERTAVHRYLDPRLPVIELGGCVGIVACVTNKRLDDPTRHVVVEASPPLAALLRRNAHLNQCRFTVLNCAVAYNDSFIELYVNPDMFVYGSIYSGNLHSSRAVRVPTTTLGQILERFPFEQFTLVCDIEGAEYDLVENEASLMAQRVATLIVEVTPGFETRRDAMLGQLSRLGFEQLATMADVVVFRNVRHSKDVAQP